MLRVFSKGRSGLDQTFDVELKNIFRKRSTIKISYLIKAVQKHPMLQGL